MSKSTNRSIGCLSYMGFYWLNGILSKGLKRPLEKEDFPNPPNKYEAKEVENHVNDVLEKEVLSAKLDNRPPRLWRIIFHVLSWKTFLTLLFLQASTDTLRVCTAIGMWFYLTMLTIQPIDAFYSGIAAGLFSLGVVIFIVTENHLRYLSFISAIRIKTAVIEKIYNKILTTRRSDIPRKLQNLISTDAEKMEALIRESLCFVVAPFAIAAFVISLWILIGPQSLYGACFVVMPILYSVFVAYISPTLRHKQAALTDKRLSLIQDTVSGIRSVKTFVWEDKYMSLIHSIRRREMAVVLCKGIIYATSKAVRLTAHDIPAFISIVAMINYGIHLSAVEIFTITTILHNINRFVARQVIDSITKIQEARVAMQRMEKFLLEENCTASDMGIAQEKVTYRGNESSIITLTNASASWGPGKGNVLSHISVTAQENELLIITGNVGSGKSSLLMMLQKEIPLTQGILSTRGKLAFVPQIPWIFSGTIRENVTFGLAYNEKKFQQVIDACCLKEDIRSFPKEDQTKIGQRGVMLSGGQRARVSLARAVYSDSDVYLLDDPLSAVDVKVGQEIFDKCICGALSGKLRLLVTHQHRFLHRANSILLLKNGRMEFHGTFEEFQKTSHSKESMNGHSEESKNPEVEKDDRHSNKEEGSDLKEAEEDREIGHVTWKVYWSFLRAGSSVFTVVIVVLVYIIVQGFLYSPKLLQSKLAHMPPEDQSSLTTIGIYCGLVIGAFLLCGIREFLVNLMVIKSSLHLHKKMTSSVLKSPVLFFDTNPVGRIINRFSSDTGNIDDKLLEMMAPAISYTMEGIGIAFLAVYVNLWLVLVLVPLLGICVYYCRLFLKNSREVCRLQAISCSPVYAHFDETKRGLEVIRSLQMEQQFKDKMHRSLDEYIKTLYIRLSMASWIGIRIDGIVSIFTISVIILGVTVFKDEALTGMLLSTCLAVVSTIQYGLRCATEVENIMTSAERIISYSGLPPESGYSRKIEPRRTWPEQGRIVFENVSLRYYEKGVTVLKNINLDIKPKERVGIVGRTGAGKSSLFSALLRMPEPLGNIFIDDVNLGQISIQAARNCMAVITQDPVLFSGTLRRNLDPFDIFTDDEILLTLKQVEMIEKISNLPKKLDFMIGEEGRGFSVGERQLLCFARALLQGSRILLIDEATANVDFETDKRIQQTIRSKITDCTVLTIAHRLDTIMDYDRVLVIDNGQIAEQGEPVLLAQDDSSIFREIMRHGPGPVTS